MSIVIAALLVLLLAASAGVVFAREPRRQVLALSVNGFVLTALFMALQAPDVAYSEIVVGGVALPIVFLAALAALRTEEKHPEAQS
jgi:uncharacterized MnhB-related membrane protein